MNNPRFLAISIALETLGIMVEAPGTAKAECSSKKSVCNEELIIGRKRLNVGVEKGSELGRK